MGPYMHFLLLLGTLAVLETWARSHSLRFFSVSVSGPELGEPRFFSVGYVDDQPLARFDSHSASRRVEPLARWMDKTDRVDPDYRDRNTRHNEVSTHFYGVTLQTLRGYFNQSESGIHTYQSLSGCEVSPELTFQRGFYQYAYDGLDYISLDTDTYTWTALVPQAVNTKRVWEADRCMLEGKKAYLEEICLVWLKKYLEMGKEKLMRTDPPSASVTRHTAPHGEVTLRCRAQDFYPKEISLTWLRDGEEHPQDTEFIETRPAGDGTFQKWAAVAMTSGQEDKYTCLVQHQGLSEPLNLKWEPPPSPTWLTVGGIAAGLLLFLLTAVTAGVGIWRKKNSGGKGGDYVSAAGNDSAQGSDVSLTDRV